MDLFFALTLSTDFTGAGVTFCCYLSDGRVGRTSVKTTCKGEGIK